MPLPQLDSDTESDSEGSWGRLGSGKRTGAMRGTDSSFLRASGSHIGKVVLRSGYGKDPSLRALQKTEGNAGGAQGGTEMTSSGSSKVSVTKSGLLPTQLGEMKGDIGPIGHVTASDSLKAQAGEKEDEKGGSRRKGSVGDASGSFHGSSGTSGAVLGLFDGKNKSPNASPKSFQSGSKRTETHLSTSSSISSPFPPFQGPSKATSSVSGAYNLTPQDFPKDSFISQKNVHEDSQRTAQIINMAGNAEKAAHELSESSVSAAGVPFFTSKHTKSACETSPPLSDPKIPNLDSSPDPSATKNISKITVRLHPIGLTPAIIPRNFQISSTQTVATIARFITKKLKIRSGVIYLYIQNSFTPTPDETVGDLFALFKTNNELVVNYCETVAFG